jgi:alkanesulfonate monooxygenase SsuD/methylene tetrahydromethanopterin reductase-like flavin-dependent oxidoreductase (luciferase family)
MQARKPPQPQVNAPPATVFGERMHGVGALSPVDPQLGGSISPAVLAEKLGYGSIWVSQMLGGFDALSLLATYATATNRVRLGSFVLPIYGSHPAVMSQAALTLSLISGGRFSLGLGISSPATVEGAWGMQFGHRVDAMRAYTTIVQSILKTGRVDYTSRYFSARLTSDIPRTAQVPVIVAALNPKMIELAAEIADGVALWMCPPAFVAKEVMPRVRLVRERLGMDPETFQVVVGLPIALTDRVSEALDPLIAKIHAYAARPHYSLGLQSAGWDPAAGRVGEDLVREVCGIGGVDDVKAKIDSYRQAGANQIVLDVWAGESYDTTLTALAEH